MFFLCGLHILEGAVYGEYLLRVMGDWISTGGMVSTHTPTSQSKGGYH